MKCIHIPGNAITKWENNWNETNEDNEQHSYGQLIYIPFAHSKRRYHKWKLLYFFSTMFWQSQSGSCWKSRFMRVGCVMCMCLCLGNACKDYANDNSSALISDWIRNVIWIKRQPMKPSTTQTASKSGRIDKEEIDSNQLILMKLLQVTLLRTRRAPQTLRFHNFESTPYTMPLHRKSYDCPSTCGADNKMNKRSQLFLLTPSISLSLRGPTPWWVDKSHRKCHYKIILMTEYWIMWSELCMFNFYWLESSVSLSIPHNCKSMPLGSIRFWRSISSSSSK